ncbi:MAG: DUF5060 domain-containing protein [Planctomycetota bacterium]
MTQPRSSLYLSIWLLVAFSLGAVAKDTPPQIPQWGRFEVFLPAAEPTSKMLCDAELTSPDGQRVAWRTFYDGGVTWKLRFMPDRIGEWSYRALLPGTDGNQFVEGKFICTETTLAGPLHALSENQIWFGRRGGGRYLMRSLHCGDRFFAENWPPADRTRFLDWAQQNRYNTLSVASCFLNRSVAGRGETWKTPKLWPIKPIEYQKLESLLNDLDRRDLMLFPFAGLLGRNSGFPADPSERRAFVRYLVTRLAPYRNILWNLAGPEPLLRRKPFLSLDEIRELGDWVREDDPFGHLITVHNATGDDVFSGERWQSFGTLQGPKTTDRAKLATVLLRNHHPSRPLYAQETLWPGNTVGHPSYTATDIRRNTLVALFCGTMVNFGDMDGNSSSGFAESLNPADAEVRRHRWIGLAWDAFDQIPWHRMRPRPDLCSGGHCLADSGSTYAVFLDGSEKTKIRMRPGRYAVKWIDAVTGQSHSIDSITEDDVLKRPRDAGDWIVVLTREPDEIVEQNGIVRFEAEDGVGEWTVVKTPSGQAIRDPGGGRQRYKIRFQRGGRYYVFLYAKQGPRGRDKENDVLLSLDGERLFASDHETRPDGMRSYGDWKWTKLPKGPGFHTPKPIKQDGVYFHVPQPGTYTFEIAHRSKNFEIDCVLMQLESPLPPTSR